MWLAKELWHSLTHKDDDRHGIAIMVVGSLVFFLVAWANLIYTLQR